MSKSDGRNKYRHTARFKKTHNSHAESAKGKILLAMMPSFDGRYRSEKGAIVCYSFFKDNEFIRCLTGIIATDPGVMGQPLAEVLHKLAGYAAKDMKKNGCRDCSVTNGVMYHPGTRNFITHENPHNSQFTKCTLIPTDNFKQFLAVFAQHSMNSEQES